MNVTGTNDTSEFKVFMTAEVLKATGGKLLHGRGDLNCSHVCTDSRKVGPGALFVALCGERFDGHDFAEESARRGARGVVVQEPWKPSGESLFHDPSCPHSLISVPDSLRALQDLAHAWRMRHAIPVAAVTGTNGKTSTKEMIYSILSLGHTILRSPGNLNNHIGVPLSLFEITPETQAAVLEFGMSGFGEIRRLREIARPSVVVITNVSAAHMMSFKSVDDVARAKGEILEELPAHGWAILNRDDDRVYGLRRSVQAKVLTFGMNAEADVTARGICVSETGTRFELRHGGESTEIVLPVPGIHQVSNALAAAAVARVFGRSLAAVRQGLSGYRPLSLRWETFHLPNGSLVINDAYNANPESMAAAIRTVQELKSPGRNIAVLGDMLELGELSENAHRELGALVARSTFDVLLTVGREAERTAQEAIRKGMDPGNVHQCLGWEEASEKLRLILRGQDRILIKASRGVGLERVAQELKQHP